MEKPLYDSDHVDVPVHHAENEGSLLKMLGTNFVYWSATNPLTPQKREEQV
jgi:hypothetical protein